MTKKETTELHNKLDEMIKTNNDGHLVITKELQNVALVVARLDEHQKAINGTVGRHEKKFADEKKVTNELMKELKTGFKVELKDINTLAQANKWQLAKYGGIAIGITVIISIVSFLLTLKTQGYI